MESQLTAIMRAPLMEEYGIKADFIGSLTVQRRFSVAIQKLLIHGSQRLSLELKMGYLF